MRGEDSNARLRWRAVSAGVLTLSAAVRLSSPWDHFTAAHPPDLPLPDLKHGVLVAADADAAMHTRRALAWAEQFPWPPLHDPFLGFPDGASFPWAPGWDAVLAAFAWLLGGGSTERFGFQAGLALFPLVVGVLTVAVVLSGTRRLFGDRAALTAGLVVALAPQHVAATQWARPDHSGAEGLFLAGLILALARDTPCRRRVSLWTAGACLVWVGGFLYAAIAAVSVALSHLSRPQPGARLGLQGIALGAGLALPVSLFTSLQSGSLLDYARLSLFHPLAIALTAGGGAWLLAWRQQPNLKKQILGALGLLLGAGILAGAARTGLSDWMNRGDPWLATVTEMQPLLAGGMKGVPRALRLLGLGVLLLPFCLVHVARTSPPAIARLPLWAAACCLCLALAQNRFGWTLTPLMGIVLGASLARLTRWAPLIALVLFVRSPEEAHAAWVAPKARKNRTPWAFEAYRWLATTDPVDPIDPEWGVLGSWRHGHWVNVVGGRPSAIGHFGTYAGGTDRYELTEKVLLGSVDALHTAMDAGRYRYLVFSADELDDTPGPLGRLLFGGSGGGGLAAVPGLRPVFASSRPHPLVSPDLPGAWVYERVNSAKVQGMADPGARVEFLLLISWMGEWRSWRTETRADPSGFWQVQVPVWTGDTGAVASQDTAYVKLEGRDPLALRIPEATVRDGLIIDLGPTEPIP